MEGLCQSLITRISLSLTNQLINLGIIFMPYFNLVGVSFILAFTGIYADVSRFVFKPGL